MIAKPILPCISDRFAFYEQKFRSLVNRKSEADCWPWCGNLDAYGYGRFFVKKRQLKAHRVAYLLHHGVEPPGDRLVCHTCDNPVCCNPGHLWIGTFLDNHRDMIAKGRKRLNPRFGERASKAKLTIEQVRAILGDGRPTKLISADYGVNISSINAIRSGRSWRKALRSGAVESNEFNS